MAKLTVLAPLESGSQGCAEQGVVIATRHRDACRQPGRSRSPGGGAEKWSRSDRSATTRINPGNLGPPGLMFLLFRGRIRVWSHCHNQGRGLTGSELCWLSVRGGRAGQDPTLVRLERSRVPGLSRTFFQNILLLVQSAKPPVSDRSVVFVGPFTSTLPLSFLRVFFYLLREDRKNRDDARNTI